MCEQLDMANLSLPLIRLVEAISQGVASDTFRSEISPYISLLPATSAELEQLTAWYPNTLYARMTAFAKRVSGRNIFTHSDGVIIHHQVEEELIFSEAYMYLLAQLQREALDKKAVFIHIPPKILPEDIVGYVVRALMSNQRYVDVTKIFSFAYGHQLRSSLLDDNQNVRVFGPCSRVHGHNMELHVTIRGWANPLTGMVINFSDLKNTVNAVLSWIDHGFLNDILPNTPTTCENVAPVIWQQLQAKLPNLQKIKVYETPTSYCEIER